MLQFRVKLPVPAIVWAFFCFQLASPPIPGCVADLYAGEPRPANPPLDDTIRELRRLRDAFRESNRITSNVSAEGTIQPGDRAFTLLQAGERFRLDLQVERAVGKGMNQVVADTTKNSSTVYRLCDGRNFYAVNNDGLAIRPLDSFESDWRNDLASHVYQYYMPSYDGTVRPVDEFCNLVAALLESRSTELKPQLAAGNIRVGVVADGPRLTVELIGPPAQDGSGPIDELRITLDSQRAYLPTRMEHTECPEQGESAWRRKQVIQATYQELAPGVFFLHTGTSVTSSTAPNDPPMLQSSVRIDKVQIGDFPVPEGAFDLHSLPITPGFYVIDKRVSPALDYIYSQSPFQIEHLDAALRNRHAYKAPSRRPSPVMSIVQFSSCVAAVCILLLIAYRTFRGRDSTKP